MKQHKYEIGLQWVGNTGEGTKSYRGYKRDHVIAAAGKPEVPGSSDPGFRGDPSRYNPEEMLVASLSACHMLWYLHLCAVNGIVVTAYEDSAAGTMIETAESGYFEEVTLRPQVTISAASDEQKAMALHQEAHHCCYIANSVKFPVRHEPVITKADR